MVVLPEEIFVNLLFYLDRISDDRESSFAVFRVGNETDPLLKGNNPLCDERVE